MIKFLVARLKERSTQGDIAAAFIAAAAVPTPWNIGVAGALIAKAFIPDKTAPEA